MGIKVEKVRRSYEGKVVLDNLSLDIPKQSFTTILAPTGSGKTTLLRIMAGVEKPDSGKVYYNGKDMTDVPVQKRKISMVYQEFINYPSMTIYENIASPLRVSGRRLFEKEIDKKVREIAELLRMDHILNHLPEEVSGGEKQRTAIARALVKGSEFIFLDEPLANLDYKLREELRGEFKTIFGERTIIYATPEPIDALAMSTHLAFLHKGKIVQFGSVQEVYSKPKYVEVGFYFNNPPMNILDCELITKNGNHYLSVSEEIEVNVEDFKNLLTENEYLLGIRPQDLSVTKDKEEVIPFEATVEFTEIVGSATTLHLIHKEKKLGIVIRDPVKYYKRDQKIKIYFDPECAYIYSKKTRELVIAQSQAVSLFK